MSIYSDINSIKPTLKSLLLDVQSVYQSLFNLFNTKFGERLFIPELSFQLEDELFELIDETSSVSIFNVVLETITRWEPRVVIDTSRTKVTPYPDDNRYELDLFFQIKGIEGQTFQYTGNLTK